MLLGEKSFGDADSEESDKSEVIFALEGKFSLGDEDGDTDLLFFFGRGPRRVP